MSDSITIAEGLAASIRQAALSYHPGVEEAPVAVLWTDPEEAWRPLIPQIRGLIPELLVLGEYKPEERQGPVIWLKTALAGKVEGIEFPKDRVPVLYLPAVARYQLRNADQCPWELQPLTELLYRGVAWTHKNGRDWTVEGFFMAEEGLGLDVAQDESTRLSLRSALSVLAQTPVSQLVGKRLEAVNFDAIVIGDTPRDLLTWIGRGNDLKAEWGTERWHAFRSRCRDDFGFDPEKEAPLNAAEHLGKKDGKAWDQLWTRLCEAPGIYAGVRDRLNQAQPTDVMAFEPETWPRENAKREEALRKALTSLKEKPAHQARQAIAELEKEHAPRRKWVWAKTGEAPLALSLKSLNRLGETTQSTPSFSALDDFVRWYEDIGWQADAAALHALRDIDSPGDEPAVRHAIRSVYQPWLEEVCMKFQVLVANADAPKFSPLVIAAEECVLFVDGLRLDLARELTGRLEAIGCKVEFATRFGALPTVTPTAKPAVSPIAGRLRAGTVPPDFRPNDPEGKPLSPHRFNKLLTDAGFMRLDEAEDLVPIGATPRGWCETGRIDGRGHDLEAEMAAQLPQELARIVSLIQRLFFAGWQKIRIVTDHGWLLLPGGLQKFDLPGFLVESRWTRCACIKGQSKPDAPAVPWHWNPAEHVIVAPGAMSFRAGVEYSHGGVSPQECILPELTITSDGAGAGERSPRIASIKWKRLRCNIEVANVEEGLRAEVRKADGATVPGATKEVEPDGQVSLLVADETLEGKPVNVVLLSKNDDLLAKADTKVGG